MERNEEAAIWAAEEFELRTRLVAAGKGGVGIAHPGYRVNFSEVAQRFGLRGIGSDRSEFHAHFLREITARRLNKVLTGEMKSDEWVALHPITSRKEQT